MFLCNEEEEHHSPHSVITNKYKAYNAHFIKHY